MSCVRKLQTLCIVLAMCCAGECARAGETVLSIGNSLIEFNAQPAMIEALAASAGQALSWTQRYVPGQTLQFHWDEGTDADSAGAPTARNLIRRGGWTHIVLQEFSNRPLVDPEAFFAAARLFKAEIATFCPEARILLFENWPYSDAPDYAADMSALDDAYLRIAMEIHAEVLPVGKAFDLLRVRDGFNRLDPYVFVDNKHPSVLGSYLSACVIYRFLHSKPRRRLSFFPSDLTEAQARILQNRAKQTLRRARRVFGALAR